MAPLLACTGMEMIGQVCFGPFSLERCTKGGRAGGIIQERRGVSVNVTRREREICRARRTVVLAAGTCGEQAGAGRYDGAHFCPGTQLSSSVLCWKV